MSDSLSSTETCSSDSFEYKVQRDDDTVSNEQNELLQDTKPDINNSSEQITNDEEKEPNVPEEKEETQQEDKEEEEENKTEKEEGEVEENKQDQIVSLDEDEEEEKDTTDDAKRDKDSNDDGKQQKFTDLDNEPGKIQHSGIVSFGNDSGDQLSANRRGINAKHNEKKLVCDRYGY